MNVINCKWLKYGLFGALALIGFNACTDDHFDIHSSTPQKSLWEQIAANPQLDSLRQILEKTTFTVDEYSKTGKLTYAELLKGSQTFTVWAPEDGSYNAAKYLEMLSEGRNREVEKQFVRNHIARYNFSGINGGDTIKVTMLNSKVNEYNLLDNTFRKIAIEGQTTPASNGSLHVLKAAVPFASNIYEAIEFTPGLDSLYNFLHEDDTLIFMKGASTPGATVNGEIQYVDSVFQMSNKVITNTWFWQNEDSLYFGVYPNNDAWPEVKSKVSKFFKYRGSGYPYVENGTTTVLWNKFDTDSMADVRIKSVVLGNIVTSIGKQPGYNVAETSLSYFKNFIDNADSIVRGGATSIDDPNIPQPYAAKIFGDAEPFELSNGYAYSVGHYGYTPSKSWHRTIRVEAEHSFYQDVNNFKAAAKTSKDSEYFGSTVWLSSLNRNDSVVGTVSNNSFAIFEGSSSASTPTISFNIPDILSGKYDIYAVMVPLNMDRKLESTENTKRNKFTAQIIYDFNEKTGKELKGKDAINPFPISSKNTEFDTRPGVVDSVLLFRDFEFPYAFKGAEPSYPKIRLTAAKLSKADKEIYDNALYVDCFVFVSKDDDADVQ